MEKTGSQNTIRFNSRKDNWLTVVIWGSILICLLTIYLIATDDDAGIIFALIYSLIMLALIVFMMSIYFNTYYLLNSRELIIYSGPMKKIIPLDSITEMTKKTDVLSNPALSIKRINIKYKKSYIGVQISPMDRDYFLEVINERIKLLQQ